MYFGANIVESTKKPDKPIFEIELSDNLLNEETMDDSGINPGLGKARICIYSGEGPIAHFHIEDKNFHTCIKLDSPEYFDHGGKYKDKLSSKQVKSLIEKLYSTPKKYKNTNLTLYELLVLYWNDNNREGKPVNRNRNSMPDYTKLK